MLCGSSAAGHVERLLSFQVTGVHDTWNRSCRTGLSNGRGTPEVPVGRISPPAFRAHWHLGLGASHFCPAIGRQYGDGGFLSSCESVARTTVCWLCIKFICLSDYTSRSPSRLYPSQLSAMAVNCRNSIYHFNNRLPSFFMYLVSNAEKVYSLVLLLLVGGVQRAE